jgi:sister-chromatid-cohesion protein PDS5
MSEIIYPQGCRSVTEDLGPDELIRRLKVLKNRLHHYYNNTITV